MSKYVEIESIESAKVSKTSKISYFVTYIIKEKIVSNSIVKSFNARVKMKFKKL